MGIKAADRKILWTRARNQCAFPECGARLTEDLASAGSGFEKATVIGQEAHIRSARRDGPRHDPDYPEPKLDTYENLLLLCPTHHITVDANNGDGFSVADLEKMRARHEQRQDLDRIDMLVRSFMGGQFTRDDAVLFEQVDLHGPRVDAMFVDVPISCSVEDPVAEILASIAAEHPGDVDLRLRQRESIAAGAAQALLHPQWRGHGLIVGGPGQGKSTLLQYVCQFHRARLLGLPDYTGEDQRLIALTETPRVTVRIDLREYAFWASQHVRAAKANRKKGQRRSRETPPWPILEEYLAYEIAQRTAREFSVDDLATVIATRPTLLAFDGLDEVADLKHREQAGNEIVELRARLEPDALDLMLLVASRPGTATSRLWSSPHFPQLTLLRLTHGLQLQYLQKWGRVAKLPPAATEKLQRTFEENEHVPHFRELAAYPMQLAILLHLLHRKQFLPQQRTGLYTAYLQTFLDREQGAEKEPLLQRERKVIEDVHALIAWHIHTESEKGRSSGSIKTSDLKRLVREHLSDRDDDGKLWKRLFEAVTGRVLCLIERDDGWFQFEVASLREYFTAVYLFQEPDPVHRDDCLRAMVRRPYWSNVCRFFVGMYTSGEVRGIRGLLQELATEPDLRRLPLLRTMAASMLSDGVYEGHMARSVQEVVDFILEGNGVLLAEDGLIDGSGAALTFADGGGRAQAVAHGQRRLAGHEPDPATRRALADVIDRHVEDPSEIFNWWWSQFDASRAWTEVAAALRLFAELTTEQTGRVASALASSVDERSWATSLLHRGEYDGNRDEILKIVKDEINKGAAYVIPAGTTSTSTGRLLSRARSCQLVSPHRAEANRTRLRRRDGAQVLAKVVQATDGLVVPREPTVGAWRPALEAVATAWGPGWVLWRAVAAAPAVVDLAQVARQVKESNPNLAAAAAYEAAARNHRDDVDWWKETLLRADTDVARRHWACSVLTVAHTTTVVELSDLIRDLVDGMPLKYYEALAATLRASQKVGMGRQLLVGDALRRGRGSFSPRSLWLIRQVASESSLERIDGLLVANCETLMRETDAESPHLARALADAAKFPVTSLRGQRESRKRSPGTSVVAGKVTVNRPLAEEILDQPSVWPSDLTQVATRVLEGYVVGTLVPISTVAEEQGWFSHDDD